MRVKAKFLIFHLPSIFNFRTICAHQTFCIKNVPASDCWNIVWTNFQTKIANYITIAMAIRCSVNFIECIRIKCSPFEWCSNVAFKNCTFLNGFVSDRLHPNLSKLDQCFADYIIVIKHAFVPVLYNSAIPIKCFHKFKENVTEKTDTAARSSVLPVFALLHCLTFLLPGLIWFIRHFIGHTISSKSLTVICLIVIFEFERYRET